MYKPFTIELFQIQQYLKERFDLNQFLQKPVSRDTVVLQDKNGEQIAFTCQNKTVSQIPIPTALTREEVNAYIRCLRKSENMPQVKTFEDVTRWWCDNPNPLTYQQALGLSDELYAHFLTHKIPDDESVLQLVQQDVISEDDYKSLHLWCLNRRFQRCYLGFYGVDGNGDSYNFIWNYGEPNAVSYIFYIKNEYYCFMHGIPYPG